MICVGTHIPTSTHTHIHIDRHIVESASLETKFFNTTAIPYSIAITLTEAT